MGCPNTLRRKAVRRLSLLASGDTDAMVQIAPEGADECEDEQCGTGRAEQERAAPA